jgi:hypothetical protein
VRQTKKGEEMAWLSISDASGSVSCAVFPNAYQRLGQPAVLREGAFLVARGRLAHEEATGTNVSQTKISRSRGNGRCGTCPSQVAHCACVDGFESVVGASGNSARTCKSSVCSHGCRTTFGALVTPLARTWPVAGRNRVSSLAVPPRMYSCG